MSIRTSVTQYDGFMLRRYSKTGHWGTFEHFAEGEGINVSGILFVFDELVNHNIISPKDAAAHLEALYESNVRLPNEEVVKRLEQWK